MRTGMPEEHEMPAPVRTTIFLDFATARERVARVRLVEKSVRHASRSRVTVMVARVSACKVAWGSMGWREGVRGETPKLGRGLLNMLLAEARRVASSCDPDAQRPFNRRQSPDGGHSYIYDSFRHIIQRTLLSCIHAHSKQARYTTIVVARAQRMKTSRIGVRNQVSTVDQRSSTTATLMHL